MRRKLPTCSLWIRSVLTLALQGFAVWASCVQMEAQEGEGAEVEVIKQLAFVEQRYAEAGVVEGIQQPYAIQVSPEGGHVYVASLFNDAVSFFARNPEDGVLSYGGYFSEADVGDNALDGARSLAMSPDGEYLYAVSMMADSLVSFDRNKGTGSLTFLASLRDGVGGVDGLDGPRSVIVSPDGKNLYVGAFEDDKISVFSRNPGTGLASFLGVYVEGDQGVQELSEPHALAMSPDGKHLYVALWSNQVVVFSRDTGSGLLSYKSKVSYLVAESSGSSGTHRAIACSPDGRFLYVSSWNTDSVTVFSRNLDTGALSHVANVINKKGSVENMDGPHGLAISQDGAYLYVAAFASDAVVTFERDLESGTISYFQSIKAESGDEWNLNGPISIGISPDGEHAYVGSGAGTHSVVTFRREVLVDPPELVVEPVDRSIEEGESVAFHALAQGVELSYQWLRNGDSVPGETLPALTLESVSAEEDGDQFQIRVSNAGGILTSEAVTLTVLPPIELDAPSDLTALDISSNSARLAWRDESDNETSFEIQRRVQGGSFSTIATVLENTIQFEESSLASSTTYIYRLRAKRNETFSLWSNDAVIESFDDVPQAPTNLDVIETTYNKVALRWSDRSAVEDGFRVLRRADEIGAGWELVSTADKNATSYVDRDVEVETTYAYQVQAYNESGISESSNSVVAITNEIPVASISPTENLISRDAASGFAISVNSDKSWEAISDVAWLIVTSPSNGQGTESQGVAYRALLNESQSERVGRIVVGGLDHVVTQEGSPPFLRLSNATSQVGAAGGTILVRVESNVDWVVSESADWLSIASGQSGSNYGTVRLSVTENDSFEARSVSLQINDAVHTVSQSGVAPYLSLTSDRFLFGGDGGQGLVTVNSNQDWSASVSEDWISLIGDASGSGDGEVAFELEANEGGSTRSADVLVGDVSISISQSSLEVSELDEPEWVSVTVGPLGAELQWEDRSDSEIGFRVGRRLYGSEANFETITELGEDETEYFDRGAPRGQRVEYRLAAFDALGESDPATRTSDELPESNLVYMAMRVGSEAWTKAVLAGVSIAGTGEIVLQRKGYGEELSRLTFGGLYPVERYELNWDDRWSRGLGEASVLQWAEHFHLSELLSDAFGNNEQDGLEYVARAPGDGDAYPRGGHALGQLLESDSLVLAAFEIAGETSLPILLQGKGRSLEEKGFASPATGLRLALYSVFDDGSVEVVASNSDWREAQGIAGMTIGEAATKAGVSETLSGDGEEARLLLLLEPGKYYVLLDSDTDSEGSAMIEVFDLR